MWIVRLSTTCVDLAPGGSVAAVVVAASAVVFGLSVVGTLPTLVVGSCVVVVAVSGATVVVELYVVVDETTRGLRGAVVGCVEVLVFRVNDHVVDDELGGFLRVTELGAQVSELSGGESPCLSGRASGSEARLRFWIDSD
jgi:hypothetical protein